jgi:hypothetical protein
VVGKEEEEFCGGAKRKEKKDNSEGTIVVG